MFKPKYQYNHKTLSYIQTHSAVKHFLRNFLLIILPSLLIGATLSFFLFSFVFVSPMSKASANNLEKQNLEIDALRKQNKENISILKDLQDRDDNLYRVVYEADPIPASVRKAGYGGSNRYESLAHLPSAKKLTALKKDVDLVQRQLYIQMKSYEELVGYAKNKEQMLACRPAIQPILNADLKRTASGWGWRMHPIYRVMKFHYGMDFTAPTGTPAYATGNGVVKKAEFERGFGNLVIIDHGYGYETYYAHLSAYNVKVGQKVNRGDVVAYVGSTGTSTGPHLHYEVHYKGAAVDPKNYYFIDLSPTLYDEMVTISSNQGKSFD